MVLAPVVRDRKGEFAELFERHAGAGLRALSRRRRDRSRRPTLPKLKKTEKHDIDVVIDRVKVQPGDGPALQQRLAESFEAALRIADGRAIALEMDERRREHLCSAASSPARSAATRCPSSSRACSRSTRRSAPARPATASAQVTVFDAERVVAFPSLSLASGAVKGWDRRNAYTFSLLESVARHYGFDIDTPFEELPRRGARGAAARLGRGRDRVRLRGRGRARAARAPSSAGIRSKASCRTSSGAFARPIRRRCAKTWRATRAPSPARIATARGCAREARHVFLQPTAPSARAASRSTRSSTPRCARPGLLRDADARRRQGRDRRQGGARDPLAPEVPQRRRPQLPEPRPQRRHAVGRRGAAHPARHADRLGPDRRDVRARRAAHRPAPARQRAPDRHAAATCATSATACSSSSTTRTRSAPPTT